MYKGNLGCKQFSIANNIRYTHKIRVRPDSGKIIYKLIHMRPEVIYNCLSIYKLINTTLFFLGLLDFFPPYNLFDFGPNAEKGCNSTIFYSNTAIIKAIGGQDLFAVGLAKDMDNYFDLYLDLISKPLPKFIQQYSIWMAEEFMLNNLLEKYAICLDMNVV
jgi:hypothetical protein